MIQSPRVPVRLLFCVVAAGVLSICGGCKLASNLNPLPKGEPKMTAQELLQDLRSFVIRTVRAAETTADGILQNSNERREQFRMLNLKIGLDRELRRIVEYSDPPHALVEVWGILERALNFVDSASGEEFFGEHTATIKSFYVSAERSVQEIAKRVFDAEQFDEISAGVAKFAAENPLLTGEVRAVSSTRSLSTDEGSALGNIVSNPTRIFSHALGVDDTAKAINAVTAAADRIAFTASGIPQSARWEMERLLFAVDTNETAKSILADVDNIAQASKKLAETADALPARLRQEVSTAIDQIDAKQVNLRKTISQVDEVVKSVDAVLSKASTTLQDFERGARALEAAGKAVEPVMKEISKLAGVDEDPKAGKEVEAADDGRPFDILDYAKTCEALTRTAGELRVVLTELNELTGGDHLPSALEKLIRSTDVTIENTGKQAQELTDHVFWRAVQLVLVLLVAFVAYRWISTRIKVPTPARG